MAVYGFCSASGSPGVTTAAIGCSVSWPGSVLLVDADSQNAVVTGLLAGQVHPAGSILQVIADIQAGKDARDAVWDQATQLPGDDPTGHRRLFLPGVRKRRALASVDPMWPQLASGLAELGSAGIDVVVDLGRMDGLTGVPEALMSVATEVTLFLRPTLREVAAARWTAELLARQAGSTGKVRLVLVEPAMSRLGFDDSEVAAALHLPVRSRIPYDPQWAAVWSDGAPAPARWRPIRSSSGDHSTPVALEDRRGRYRHAVAQLATRLHDRARLRPESAFLAGGAS